MAQRQEHVLGDWGTTRLRLYRIADGQVVDRAEGPGIGGLSVPPAQILVEALAPWRDAVTDVTLCGMAGARGGLIEAPYAACPTHVEAWRGQRAHMDLDGLAVAVLPGLCQYGAGVTPDVMRGEETQIFGALLIDPALAQGDHLFLLPGTHSKWVEVRDGVVQGFRTFPTGELYALLAKQSTLLAGDPAGEGSFDAGFDHGLIRAAEPLTAALFEARAARLLEGRSADWAKGYLSALLIGGEVAAQAKARTEVVVIGDPALCSLYERALAAADWRSRMMDGDAAVLAGLHMARGWNA